MASTQLQVQPGTFNISPEAEEGRLLLREALSPIQEPSHLESALPPESARRVVEEMLSLTRPVRTRLTIEGERSSVSLELSLRVDQTAGPGFRLTTTDKTKGVAFVLNSTSDGRGTLQFNVRYVGLPVDKALSYARFLSALYWKEGALYLIRLGPGEDRFKLLDLPVPLDSAARSEADDRVRFLEALYEIGKATDTQFVCPSEIDDEDLRDLNYVLKAIRGGWVALPVTDFTTPMGPDGVRNVLDLAAQEGEVFERLAMTAEWERHNIFGVWIDLGPSVRYIPGARLATPRSEMEEWLASRSEPDDSFNIRWVPVDGAWVHVFYHEWPKPSLDAIREDMRAFEEEYGRSSDEFREAWDSGEEWARELDGGDVWMTLLDAERYLQRGPKGV